MHINITPNVETKSSRVYILNIAELNTDLITNMKN